MDVGRRAFLLGKPLPHPSRVLKAVIGEGCLARQGVTCRTCGERCDAAAIAFPPRLGGPALPRLDADACTGCGDCATDCPAGAIAMLPFIPAERTLP